MSQLPLRERVANERRRLKSVREALTAAVTQGAKGDPAYVAFYVAVADYMDASMHRLHIQDVRMGEMIRARLGGKLDAKAEKALAELGERLGGNQAHLQELLGTRELLRKEGAARLAQFERAAGDYTRYITTNMGHHGGTTDLAQSLFSMDDWAYMAGVTEDETKHEQALYDRVFAAVPKSLKLPAG